MTKTRAKSAAIKKKSQCSKKDEEIQLQVKVKLHYTMLL